MQTTRPGDHQFWTSPSFIMVICATFGVFLLFGGFGWVTGDPVHFYSIGLSTANRIMNQLLGVVLTSIALVIPLTSNLYTPKLVRLYLGHPLIIVGLFALVFGQLMVVTALMINTEHTLYVHITFIAMAMTLFCLAGILPYLFFISHFLRPSYFMPLLVNRAAGLIKKPGNAPRNDEDFTTIFETVAVITNIALTGMQRGDRQLIMLCLASLHELLSSFLVSHQTYRDVDEKLTPYFVPGLVREGQEYLTEHRIWPEVYILAQMLEIMEQADKSQHQLLAETAHLLVETVEQCIKTHREDLVEIHILVFNALMRQTIESRDVRKFQNLSYHYRLLMEELSWMPMWMEEVVKHLVHYGEMSIREGMHGGYETVLYDLGELALSLAKQDPHLSTEFVENHAAPIWFEAMSRGGHLEKAAWRSLTRVFWESRVQDNRYLTQMLEDTYLIDKNRHKQCIEEMLRNNRPLHWEFNDRLLRMSYLSEEAENLAWDFISHMEEASLGADESLDEDVYED